MPSLKKKLLVIVPSRNRIISIKRMLHSFNETKGKETKIIICIDDDEPALKEYMKLEECVSIHDEHRVTGIINNTWRNNDWFDYYSVSNDDYVYHTKGWDKQMIERQEKEGPGVSYGDDMFHGEDLPTTSVIHRDVVRAAGWLQLPTLNHGYYGDNVWKTIGRGVGNLYYHRDIKIEHLHFLNGKAEKDSFSQSIYDDDRRKYVDWLAFVSNRDIARIRYATKGY